MVGTCTIFRNTLGGATSSWNVPVYFWLPVCYPFGMLKQFTDFHETTFEQYLFGGHFWLCMFEFTPVSNNTGRGTKLHGSDTNSTYFDTLEGRMVFHLGKV